MKNIAIFALSALLISACSSDSKTVIKSQTEHQNPTQKANFLDGQIQVYKNSQGVEGTLNDANEQRRKEMEEQGI